MPVLISVPVPVPARVFALAVVLVIDWVIVLAPTLICARSACALWLEACMRPNAAS